MTNDQKPQNKRFLKRLNSETRNLFSRLPSTYSASRSQGQKILKRAGGISIVEWRMLWDLTEAGSLSVRQLARLQRTDHSQVSRALPAMKAKGFVTMDQSSDDGRQIIVTLAEKGRDAYEKAKPIMARRREMLKSEFTDEEVTIFIDFLNRFDALLCMPIDNLFDEEENV